MEEKKQQLETAQNEEASSNEGKQEKKLPSKYRHYNLKEESINRLWGTFHKALEANGKLEEMQNDTGITKPTTNEELEEVRTWCYNHDCMPKRKSAKIEIVLSDKLEDLTKQVEELKTWLKKATKKQEDLRNKDAKQFIASTGGDIDKAIEMLQKLKEAAN